jgi:hypothetical protein
MTHFAYDIHKYLRINYLNDNHKYRMTHFADDIHKYLRINYLNDIHKYLMTYYRNDICTYHKTHHFLSRNYEHCSYYAKSQDFDRCKIN